MSTAMDQVHLRIREIPLDHMIISMAVNEKLSRQVERDLQVMTGNTDFIDDTTEVAGTGGNTATVASSRDTAEDGVAYCRIIGIRQLDKLNTGDKARYSKMTRSNHTAATDWSRQQGRQSEVPLMHKDTTNRNVHQ